MPTQATIISIADAIANFLTAQSVAAAFTPYTFTAVRDYAPLYKLEDLSTMHVTVCPRKKVMVMQTRTAQRQDDEIDIGILYRPPNIDPTSPASVKAAFDPLMFLVEQMADSLKFGSFGATPYLPQWLASVNDPVYDAYYLRESKQFASILTITMRGVR